MADKIIKKLNDKNYRLTKNRIDILECLNDNVHGHTINDIVNHLKEKGKKVNVASVYNTIKMLINEGIVDIYTDYVSKNQIFEIVDDSKMHIHIYDTINEVCSKEEMPTKIIHEIEKLLEKKGYRAHNIKIEILAAKDNQKK